MRGSGWLLVGIVALVVTAVAGVLIGSGAVTVDWR